MGVELVDAESADGKIFQQGKSMTAVVKSAKLGQENDSHLCFCRERAESREVGESDGGFFFAVLLSESDDQA